MTRKEHDMQRRLDPVSFGAFLLFVPSVADRHGERVNRPQRRGGRRA